MDDFNYNGSSLHFWKVTGEVVSTQKHSETHVSSSGGGGYVNQGSGYISAPTVHSRAVTQHEFWLKTEDGREVSVKLSGFDIPLREGQKVTLISAGRPGENSGWYSVLVNHNAGEHWFLNKAESLNQKLRFAPLKIAPAFSGVPAVIVAVILAFVTWRTNSTFLAFVIGGAYLLYAAIKGQSKVRETQQRLDAHLERLAQFAYSNP